VLDKQGRYVIPGYKKGGVLFSLRDDGQYAAMPEFSLAEATEAVTIPGAKGKARLFTEKLDFKGTLSENEKLIATVAAFFFTEGLAEKVFTGTITLEDGTVIKDVKFEKTEEGKFVVKQFTDRNVAFLRREDGKYEVSAKTASGGMVELAETVSVSDTDVKAKIDNLRAVPDR